MALFGVLGVIGLLLLGDFLWAKYFGVTAPPILRAASIAICAGPEPPGQPSSPPFSIPSSLWGWFVVVFCLGAFLLGSLWGNIRQASHRTHLGGTAANNDSTDAVSPHPLYQVAAVLLLGFVVFALGYEAWAVAPGQTKFWPITLYVRCADDVAPLQTFAGALIISVLLGHWLGNRSRVESR